MSNDDFYTKVTNDSSVTPLKKKYLTTFLKSGIELKNSNFIVIFFHKSKKKGGDSGGLCSGKML